MKFEDIFKQYGWYTTESFADGVYIEITNAPHGSEIEFKYIKNPDDIIPETLNIKIYRGLFDKKFVKVLNRNQLFGETRANLFK